MPVKNAGQYLKPCLDSILAQSFTDWELIAINDSSTDGSNEVLKEYASNYGNILTANSTGKGIVDALQKAHGLSSGDSIHRMDADDLMPANKLELMSAALEKGCVVTGKVSYFCDEHKVGEGFAKYTNWLNGLMESGDFWRDVYRECPIPSSAWLMYNDDFKRIGGFSSSLMPEDYDLAFRILKHKLKVVRLNEIVHHWRDSESRTSRNEKQYFPISYLPLKVHYFLELEKDKNKELFLWGAGKKGKLVAKELISKNKGFTWVTNNKNKVGRDIYGVVLQSDRNINHKKSQVILALSSPTEQTAVHIELEKNRLKTNNDYFWFF